MLSVEAENVLAAEEGPEAVREAWETSKLEAETLARRRTDQVARNPVTPIPGALDTFKKLWLDNSERGPRDYWSAAQASAPWRLPTEPELLAIVAACPTLGVCSVGAAASAGQFRSRRVIGVGAVQVEMGCGST